MIIKSTGTHIHFIGIGGIGMSALAEVSLQLGCKVSGSDAKKSSNIDKLVSLGANVSIGHASENVKGATVVVYSSAISKDNPEYKNADDLNIPIMKRAELLADLMRLRQGIAIAGTHGKTTSTSIVATLLKESNKDPTYIIGGIVKNLGGHAYVGKGDFLVAEADESDGSFLLLNPVHSIITNIDDDHLDFYGSRENLFNAFEKFANKIPFYGVCALNADDEKLRKISERMHKPFVTFGLNNSGEDINYYASNIKYNLDGVVFTLIYNGKDVGDFKLALPGDHNILNALGAIAVCHESGLSFTDLRTALLKFSGVGRRFQKIYKNDNFTIIDDYGHHPTEISETIKTAKKSMPDSELVVLFEPHRFTRTKSCWGDFLHCFNGADRVLLAPIYPANEEPIIGINSENLVNDINKLHPSLSESFTDWNNIKELIDSLSSKNATLLVLGAGAVGAKVKDLVKA